MSGKLKKNDEIELFIESISSEGSGVGHHDGMAVFVDGAVSGDRILAHIIKVKSSYAVGIIKKVLSASVFRIEVDCPVFSKCGGCAFRQIEYSHELEMKRRSVEDALQRIGRLDVSVREILSVHEIDHYRNKGIYPVGFDEKGKTVVGFYSKRSHRIVDCKSCLLAPVEFESIINIISRWAAEFGVSLYNEESHTGLLRYIYLRKGFSFGQIMVCLIINGDVIPAGDILVERLVSAFSSIKSIALNINKDKTNVALGKNCFTIFGPEYIEDELCGLKFRISPLSFFQVNPEGAELLYEKAKEFAALSSDEVLLDLYCGTGTIGLSMARECKEVIGVEVIEEAIENAEENAAVNGIENARFICADAGEAAKTLQNEGLKPDCVVLDPPRKGCSEETLDAVIEMKPDRVVYVSCNPSTLARDCRILADNGFELKEVTAVDMFPRTNHVETVVQLVRKTPDMYVDFKIDLDEQDLTASEAHPTYEEIKAYIQKEYGVKVSSLYISQVKRKLGLEVSEAYNKPKSVKSKTPQCPEEKEKAIVAALKYYKMI